MEGDGTFHEVSLDGSGGVDDDDDDDDNNDAREEEDDSFQEIALDDAPVHGLLHYHGFKAPNRRPRRRRFKRALCHCTRGRFEAFALRRRSTVPEEAPAVSIALVQGQFAARRNDRDTDMFHIAVEGQPGLHHFSIPSTPGGIPKASSLGHGDDDDDDDADADADFDDTFEAAEDALDSGAGGGHGAGDRPLRVAEWLSAIATHTTTHAVEGPRRRHADADVCSGDGDGSPLSPDADASGIDLPALRHMSPSEAVQIELDGLDLAQGDRETLSRHNSSRNVGTGSSGRMQRSPSMRVSPESEQPPGTAGGGTRSGLGPGSPPPAVRHLSGLGDMVDHDIDFDYHSSGDDGSEGGGGGGGGGRSRGGAGRVSGDDSLSSYEDSDASSDSDNDDDDYGVTPTDAAGGRSTGAAPGDGRASASEGGSGGGGAAADDDVEDDPALVTRRQRRRFSRQEKVSIVMAGTVEKLASVAPIFSKRTVILHHDRLIFTRGVGTVHSAKEVFLKDVLRAYHPDVVKKPALFKVEARKRTAKGVLKKGLVTHTFRCDNSDEWVDKIDSLLQEARAPKIN